MEEGERLSKKQLAQENRIRELRAAAEEARGAAARAEAAAAAERQKARAPAPSQAGARGPARRPRALGTAMRAPAPGAVGCGPSRRGGGVTRGGAGRRRRWPRRRAPKRRPTAQACARATARSWTPSARPRRPRCSARARRRRGAPCAPPTGLQAAFSGEKSWAVGRQAELEAGGEHAGDAFSVRLKPYKFPCSVRCKPYKSARPPPGLRDRRAPARLGSGAGACAQRPAAPVMQQVCRSHSAAWADKVRVRLKSPPCKLGRRGGAQVEAEEGARAAAREGLGRRLREAEARGDALAETVEELRAGLERQRVAADLRCALRPPMPGAQCSGGLECCLLRLRVAHGRDLARATPPAASL